MTAKPSKRIGKRRVAVAAILTLALLSVLVPAAVSTADGQTGPYVTFYTVTAPELPESSELSDIKLAAFPTPYCKLEAAGGRVADPGIPPDPGNDYGAFVGWYTAPQGAADAKRFDFSANRTEDASAFAHFRTDVLASFLDGNDNVFLTKSVPIGGKISAPDKNEMAIFSGVVGQVFSHWTVEGNSNIEYDFDTVPDTDVVLKPVFLQEKSHYVFFYSEGTQVPFTTVTNGGTVSKPEDPSRAGYEFAGWTKDRAGETPFNFANDTIDENTILYAQWTGLSVGYTVMLWNERSGISAGASFDPGDYEYYGHSVGPMAKAGTDLTSVANKAEAVAGGFAEAIAAAVADAQAAKKNDATDKIHFLDTEGYVIRSSSSAVLGDGGTIVNVYFPRKEYTIAFDLDRAGGEMTIAGRTYASGGDTYEIRAKLGQNVADVWPLRPAATFNNLGAYAFQGWLAKGDPVVYSSKQLVLGGAIASTADASDRIVLTGNGSTTASR